MQELKHEPVILRECLWSCTLALQYNRHIHNHIWPALFLCGARPKHSRPEAFHLKYHEYCQLCSRVTFGSQKKTLWGKYNKEGSVTFYKVLASIAVALVVPWSLTSKPPCVLLAMAQLSKRCAGLATTNAKVWDGLWGQQPSHAGSWVHTNTHIGPFTFCTCAPSRSKSGHHLLNLLQMLQYN